MLPLFYQQVMSVTPQSTDSAIGGIQKLAESIREGLNVVAAPPCMGTSILALTLALYLAKQGKRVLYCSTQQQIRRTFARYICEQAGVNLPLNPSDEDTQRLADAYKEIEGLHFNYDLVTLYSVHYISKKIYQDFSKHYDYIFIDCIQDILDDDLRGVLFTKARICEELRCAASIPIIACWRFPSQISSSFKKYNKILEFDIEQIHDFSVNIYFPFRPEYYHIYTDERTGEKTIGKLYVYVKKLPDKKDDLIQLFYHGAKCRIYDNTMKPSK